MMMMIMMMITTMTMMMNGIVIVSNKFQIYALSVFYKVHLPAIISFIILLVV